MIIGIFLLFLLSLSLILKLDTSAYTISVYIFLYLTYCALILLLRSFLPLNKFNAQYKNMYQKLQAILKSLTERKIVLIILLISLLAGLNRTYYLGGDDSKLFYLYPDKFFFNFSSKILPGGSMSGLTGFLPSMSIYYFSLFLMILKTILPFINLQNFLYTANLLFGIMFFYKMSDLIMPGAYKYKKQILLLASYFYVFSIFNIYIFYNAQLIAVYLVSIFPLSIYLFIKGLRENLISYIFLISILWSIFAVVSAASLWFLATCLVAFPLLLYLSRKNKVRAFIFSVVLGISLLFLNIFWLYLLPYTTLFNKTGVDTNNTLSQKFLEESSRGLRSNAELNQLFFPLNNLFHYQIQENFKWPYLGVFNSWYLKLIPISSVFILLILIAGLFKKNPKLKSIYSVSLVQLLLALYFFTLNLGTNKLGNWGISLFVWMGNKLPGFVAFRNNYDKFAFALSLAYSVALSASLLIISRKLNKSDLLKKILVICWLTAILISLPYLSGRLRNLPVWKTRTSYYTTAGLNKDYLELANYISGEKDTGRYLTLPLTRGNIAFIQDETRPDHYYVGVSPLLIMSGRNDYSGSISFGSSDREINEYFDTGDLEKLGNTLRKFNVKYVITNNSLTDDMKSNYLLGDGIYDRQNKAFEKFVTGRKIKDFGSHYSLYELNSELKSDKIFIIRNGSVLSEPSEFNKISDSEYSYTTNVRPGDELVFSEPYFNAWEVRSGNKKLDLKHNIYDGWSNSWVFGEDSLKYSEDLQLKIIFSPSEKIGKLELISFSYFGLLIMFVVYKFSRK